LSKKCKACGEGFEPFKSTDKTCSLPCAKELDNAKEKKPKSVGKKAKSKAKAKKKKSKTTAQLVEQAAVLLQRLRRLEESDDNGYCQCITSGVIGHFSEFQGGHYMGRRHTNTKLEKDNIWPQSPGDNCFLMKTSRGVAIYRRNLVEKIGEERVRGLEDLAGVTRKYTRQEALDLIEQFKREIKDQEKRLGI